MTPRGSGGNAGIILVVLVAWMIVGAAVRAEVPPAKPYGTLVAEVMGFLQSDVGIDGIRTNDNDPEGYPVPPYFYHYAIRDGNGLWSSTTGYPGYASVSYPAYTSCVAIDAFLDWRRWSGDAAGLERARQYADWILEHRTPAGDLYGNFPYSTQTNAVMGGGWDGPANMTDKAPMFGLRLLRLYDITGESAYWTAALEIADVLVATQLGGGAEDDGRWPFRAVPCDGTVTQDYTSHLLPAVRFLDAMALRTGDAGYGQARDRAWNWLLANPCNPAAADYMRWEAFYEDQSPEMQTGFGDHYSAHEMIMELTRRRPTGWQDMATAILDSVDARYLVRGPGTIYDQYEPVTLEWAGWPEATYASSLQYARTVLVLDQALAGDARRDTTWRHTALAMAAVCSHGQNDRDIAADGRMFTTIKDLVTHFNVDSWYEQNFNTVKYFLEIMGLEPELAPTGENHVLTAEAPLTLVEYPGGGVAVRWATAGGSGGETVKLAARPAAIAAAGIPMSEAQALPLESDGWYWDAAAQVATIRHTTGPVEILTAAAGVPDPEAATPLRLAVVERTPGGISLRADMAREGPLTLTVFDLRGRRVRELLRDAMLPAGPHEVVWDGRDGQSRRVAQGVYLVRGRSRDTVASARIVWRY